MPVTRAHGRFVAAAKTPASTTDALRHLISAFLSARELPLERAKPLLAHYLPADLSNRTALVGSLIEVSGKFCIPFRERDNTRSKFQNFTKLTKCSKHHKILISSVMDVDQARR